MGAAVKSDKPTRPVDPVIEDGRPPGSQPAKASTLGERMEIQR
jgi:hypothetical protein